MSPTVASKSYKQQEVVWRQYHLCLAVAEHQILGGKHFPFFFWGTRNRKNLVVEEGTKSTEKVPLPLDLPAWKKNPSGFFHNLGNLLRPLESIPVSCERVVPTEWQVRTILGDCVSKARVITVQAPQYREHASISDFLDLVNLSVQEEAALATNWIDDQTEGLQLQNLALAARAGPVMSSLLKNLTADAQHAINK